MGIPIGKLYSYVCSLVRDLEEHHKDKHFRQHSAIIIVGNCHYYARPSPSGSLPLTVQICPSSQHTKADDAKAKTSHSSPDFPASSPAI